MPWWLLGVALAGEPAGPERWVSLGIEVGAIAGPGAVGAAGSVRALVNLAPLSLELGVGEGYTAGTGRQVGRIAFGLRRYLWRGSYARLMFAHAHEVPWASFREAPGGSLAGTHDAILHRSGVELGLGWVVPVAVGGDRGRLGVSVDLSGQVYPDAHAPVAYGALSIGVIGHVGPPRRTPTRPRRGTGGRPDAPEVSTPETADGLQPAPAG